MALTWFIYSQCSRPSYRRISKRPWYCLTLGVWSQGKNSPQSPWVHHIWGEEHWNLATILYYVLATIYLPSLDLGPSFTLFWCSWTMKINESIGFSTQIPKSPSYQFFFSVRRARCRLLLVEGAAVAVMRCQYSWGCHAWMRSYRVCCCHLFILLSVLAQRFCHHVIIMCQSESQATPISLAFFTPFNPGVLIVLSPSGYGSIPIDTFLVGWTSIYQLFWGSLGTRVLTHPQVTTRLGTPKVLSCPGGSSRVIPLSQRGTCWNQLPLARYINHFFLWVRKQKLENYSGLVTTY